MAQSHGSPVGMLFAEARNGQLLVIGNRGIREITGLFLGSRRYVRSLGAAADPDVRGRTCGNNALRAG